ncbi:MAG: hypothetical protein WKG00_20345 [Polyangiaceae bacterium]
MSLRLTSCLLPLSLLATLVGCAGEDPEATSENVTSVTKPKHYAPDQQKSETKNFTLWSEYCIGDKDVTVKPTPNYDNDAVMDAATKLSRVSDSSFALYGDIKAHHKTDLPADLNGKVTKVAHEFLGYLCGEFRDRASMVEAKIEWVRRMNYLDDTDTGAWDPKGDPWQQMKQADYRPYLSLSSSLWQARKSALSAAGKSTMTVGNIENVDTPVSGTTVCDTKYMFAEYIKKGKSFDSLEAFDAGYKTFSKTNCALPEDENFFYDFRGDSNIKPNSPESNGMIWPARTITKQCDSRKAAKPYQQARPESTLSAEVCRQYFKYPFTHRWNATRAGLASWMLLDPTQGGLDSDSVFVVVPRLLGDETYVLGDKGPYQGFANGTAITPLAGWEKYWKFGALGVPDLLGFDKGKIQQAIQIAVDRHTDWYDSEYDDKMGWNALKTDQAYSPFVASSYEMSESDNFTSPGITVNSSDPEATSHKHWMFVFKVARENWFTPETINGSDKPLPNFDRVWFDETSFGDTSLANSEKAWDRMGTALEGELDSMLYLWNVPK